jgi:hypothetical protein
MDLDDRPTTAQLPRAQRSRITNGALHDRRVNGRTAAARRYRDAVDALCAEVGQPLAEMTESRRATLRMAAAFVVAAEDQQATLAQGQPVDQEQLVRQANTLQRLLCELGLARASDDRSPRSASGSPSSSAPRRVRVVLLDASDEAQAGTTVDPDGGITLRIGPEDVGLLCTPPLVDAEHSGPTEEGAGS